MLVIKFWRSHYNPQIRLSQEEILDISHIISQDYPLSISTTHPELVIVPVDPYHLYAYWNLGENLNIYWNTSDNNQESSEKNDPDNHLTLRIYSQPAHGLDPEKAKFWFDIHIHSSVSQQQVRLPSYETAYAAAIGKRYPDNRFVVFAYSNIITIPLGRSTPLQSDKLIEHQEIEGNSDLTNELNIQFPEKNKIPPKGQSEEENFIARVMHTIPANESFNPEIKKGIEVTLQLEQGHSFPESDSNITEKQYDEVQIISAISSPLKGNAITPHADSKPDYPDKQRQRMQNASGQGKT